MQFVVQSKFQTTTPKAVRENLKLVVIYTPEWKVERERGIAKDIE